MLQSYHFKPLEPQEDEEEEVQQEEEVHEEEKVLKDGKEPDPEAGISVADDWLQQAIKGVMDAGSQVQPQVPS